MTSAMTASASILIVDDEPNVQLILSDTLTRSGYSVTSVGSVAQALEEVLRRDFDADDKASDHDDLKVRSNERSTKN